MRAVRALGSQFLALVSGAVLATGLAILTPTLLADRAPERYGLLVVSAALVIVGGALSGWLSVIVGDIEALERYELSASDRDAVWSAERAQLRLLLLAALAFVVAGLALLPVRLLGTGWNAPQSAMRCIERTVVRSPHGTLLHSRVSRPKDCRA